MPLLLHLKQCKVKKAFVLVCCRGGHNNPWEGDVTVGSMSNMKEGEVAAREKNNPVWGAAMEENSPLSYPTPVGLGPHSFTHTASTSTGHLGTSFLYFHSKWLVFQTSFYCSPFKVCRVESQSSLFQPFLVFLFCLSVFEEAEECPHNWHYSVASMFPFKRLDPVWWRGGPVWLHVRL